MRQVKVVEGCTSVQGYRRLSLHIAYSVLLRLPFNPSREAAIPLLQNIYLLAQVHYLTIPCTAISLLGALILALGVAVVRLCISTNAIKFMNGC